MSLRSSIKGWLGEFQTTLGKKLFLNGKIYRDINNVTIEAGHGTTQIDHVIVSKFGIFIIETKNMNGWIFGSEKDKQCAAQVFMKNKFRFQNPLRQNYRHQKAITEFLGVDESSVHSVVMFWGECELKTKMPDNVMQGGFIPYIKSKTKVLFSDEEVDVLFQSLKEGRLPKTWATKRKHLQSLKERHESSTVCPKCGGELRSQIARRRANAGNEFLGCSNFPRCSFTKDV